MDVTIPKIYSKFRKAIIFSIFTFRNFISISSNKRVFILAHMRSGSSLLSHIISANQDVLSCGESNIRYSLHNYIKRSEFEIRYRAGKHFEHYDIILDQINHNDRTPSKSMLDGNNCQLIFLVREPRTTIASIIGLSKEFYDGSTDEDNAADYYINRLAFLTKFATNCIRTKCLFITYENLIEKPQQALSALSDFLGLEKPLTEKYRLNPYTGKSGDPSTHIFAGRIKKPQLTTYKLSEKNMRACSNAYEDFNSMITKIDCLKPKI